MILNGLFKFVRGFYVGLGMVFKYLIRMILTVVLMAVIITACAWGLFHNLYIQSRDQEYKILSNLNEGTFRRLMNTQIYGSDERLIGEIKSADFEYTEIKDISPLIQDGYIAVEDRDFRTHNGVNPKAIARAALSVAKNHGRVTQGGSTITQQLVKNTLLTQKQTLSRKAVEAFLALDIEKKFTKADIMEFYLNSCYYGNGCYGVGSACRYYFGKKPSDVTPAEAAMIIGISNNPNVVNPVASEKRAKNKRTIVLKQMLAQNVITADEYKTADNAVIEAKQITPDRTPQSYQTSYAIHCAAVELMKKDGFKFQYLFKDKKDYTAYRKKYSKQYSRKTAQIRGGGYKIYTSFKADDQEKLQKAVDKSLDDISKKKQKDGRYLLQGAAVSVDNQTGLITAIVGGRGTSDQYNRAFLASRQSGSSIKPLIDYGPAFETGKYFPSLIMSDEKIEDGPKNAGGGYKGNVTIRYAIKDSINTVAYNTLQQIGIKSGLSYLDKLEFSSLSYLDNNSSAVALGGFTNGVHVTDMARGYTAIASGGEIYDRTCITKIVNELDGNVYATDINDKKIKIYSSATAYMLTSCMEDVFDDGGTGYGLLPEGQYCAGKTGTTNNTKDGWFCGFNTGTTCVVWVGNDDNSVVPHNYGATYAGKIWKTYMTDLGGGRDKFERPDTVIRLNVGKGGYPTAEKTGKKDLFIASKEQTAERSAHDWELENTKKTAESAVTALENCTVTTLDDYYTGYKALLEKAQNAVAAIPDVSEQKPYLERINKKVKALDEETDGWSDVSAGEAEWKSQKESDDAKIRAKEQEKLNRQNKIKAEVGRFQKYIDMVNGLKVYSATQEDLLNKAYAAWKLISDKSQKDAMLIKYNNAVSYVNRLKNEAVEKAQRVDTDPSNGGTESEAEE